MIYFGTCLSSHLSEQLVIGVQCLHFGTVRQIELQPQLKKNVGTLCTTFTKNRI